MASGDIVTNIADKETLDACYAMLQGLKDTSTSGAATSDELAYATATTSDVLSGKTFYSGNNILKTGNMPVKSAATYGASTEDQTIVGGQYLTGDQIISAVTQSGLVAENIVYGTTVKIGSGDNDSALWSVTGTASDLIGCAIHTWSNVRDRGEFCSNDNRFVKFVEIFSEDGTVTNKYVEMKVDANITIQYVYHVEHWTEMTAGLQINGDWVPDHNKYEGSGKVEDHAHIKIGGTYTYNAKSGDSIKLFGGGIINVLTCMITLNELT